MGKDHELTAESVELSTTDGLAFIEQASPLTRLHYFDGKFLKADALAQEQAYHRTQVQLSNLAGGWGVVHGLGVGLNGDQLTVGGGLAITPAGHFVLSVGDAQATVAQLLKLAAPAPAVNAPLAGHAEFGDCQGKPSGGVTETAGLGLYEITVGPIEGLCGNEAVYGALCESACVSDSRRPYWREGLVLRLRPITLKLPASSSVPFSTKHLRNRVASAYFAVEPGSTSSALSAAGLASGIWCQPASLYGRDEVVVGLLVREAGSNRVIDAWAGRRERMDTQARGYWQGRMAMRPWNVYLAQILQFQCQLSGMLDQGGGTETVPDTCDEIRATLDKTRQEIAALHQKYAQSAKKIVEAMGDGKVSQAEAQQLADDVKSSYAQLFELSESLSGVEAGQGALPKNRLLLDNGFVQLPPAGYLPVQPGKTSLPAQLSRLFGEGVRLHYRAARADVLPHLLEEAQHMERISLTKGLDDPSLLEDVEIFVPDGEVIDLATQSPGRWWDISASTEALNSIPVDGVGGVTYNSSLKRAKAGAAKASSDAQAMAAPPGQSQVYNPPPEIDGLARTEVRDDGTLSLSMALNRPLAAKALAYEASASVAPQEQDDEGPLQGLAAYVGADLQTDPFGLQVGDQTPASAELRMSYRKSEMVVAYDARFSGPATVLKRQSLSQGRTLLVVEFDASTSLTVRFNGQSQSKSSRSAIRLGLVRQGSGQTGVLLIDDEAFDPSSALVQLDWDGNPTLATLSAVITRGVETVAVQKMADLMSFKAPAAEGQAFSAKEAAKEAAKDAPEAAAAKAAGFSEQDDGTRKTLATARALTEAPAAGSSLGSLALNVLVTLSDATDDPAFLVRARRRLFPALEAAGQQEVRAVLDWVLFRRLRPTFCPPVCAVATPPQIEAFQIWHATVSSAKQAKSLAEALDKGRDDALGKVKFRPVGVLRFRDDNTQSEEPASVVKAMWQQAQPGRQVVIGRAWETRPTAGQGWQNHFRLRTMLDQIADITAPPVQGDGAIATLPKPPGPLSSGGLDGGFLVVTIDAQDDAVYTTHRVLFMSSSAWSRLEPSFKQSTASGWKQLTSLMESSDTPIVDVSLQLADNALAAGDKQTLAASDQEMQDKLESGNPYNRIAVRLVGKTLSEGEDPAKQHSAIAKALEASESGGYELKSVADLGGGAHVMSIIVLDKITPK
ncbi:MAG: hypothetical protein EOP40_00865 [Rubrivivax sp.]|nr:MAG: hypothetical protein EOP40_00865 [Rubrivivax sp.]